MSNAARKIPAEGHPFASQESKQRESLDKELHESLVEIAYREDRPEMAVLKRAARLGQLIIGFSNPHPNAMNLTATDDQSLLFTLYGVGNRSCDCWVERDDGSFDYVASVGGSVTHEGRLEIEAARRMLEWLAGRAQQIS